MIAELLTIAVVTGVVKSATAHPSKKALKAQEKYRQLEYERKQAEIQKMIDEEKDKAKAELEREELKRQERENRAAKKREKSAREKERKDALKQLYAKFAICYYIAQADGHLADRERSELDRMCLEIYNKFPEQAVKNELLKIYNTPNMSFIKLEPYILDVDPVVIASFLSLADETASLDGNVTENEKECVYKLRKYLTDKTGIDYLGLNKHFDEALDLQCPGCGSNMRLVPYENSAVCPYCGHIMHLQSSK